MHLIGFRRERREAVFLFALMRRRELVTPKLGILPPV